MCAELLPPAVVQYTCHTHSTCRTRWLSNCS